MREPTPEAAVALPPCVKNISQYDVGAGGMLSPKSPATVPGGPLPGEVAVSPDGLSAYVSNVAWASVSQFDIGAGGALSPKSPAMVPAGDDPFGVAVSPDGRSAYVANFGRPFGPPFTGGSVSQYDVGTGGGLLPKSPATVGAGDGSLDVAVNAPVRVSTTKEQCKHGGWREFPQFKNQGDCVAFVATQGENPPNSP
jgi:hypothetical protein